MNGSPPPQYPKASSWSKKAKRNRNTERQNKTTLGQEEEFDQMPTIADRSIVCNEVVGRRHRPGLYIATFSSRRRKHRPAVLLARKTTVETSAERDTEGHRTS